MTLKDKLNQFIINLNGQWVEVSDRTNIYQCYDLAANWVIALGIPKSTIQHLYAYEVYTKPNANTRDYFDLIPNTATFIPQDGDIAVFDKTPGNIAGHIGIALGGGTTKSFNLFNQNAPLGSNAHIASYNYNNPKLLGVLRPKNSAIIAQPIAQGITLQTKIPLVYDWEVQKIKSEVDRIPGLEKDLQNERETTTRLTAALAKAIQATQDLRDIMKENIEVTTTTYTPPVSPETTDKTVTIPEKVFSGPFVGLLSFLKKKLGL